MIQRGVLLVGMGLIAVWTGFAQKVEPLFSGVATFDNGLIVRYAATANQPVADSSLAGWGSGEVLSVPTPTARPGLASQKLQRFMVDSRRRIYFGYSLRVARHSMLALAAGEPARANAKPYQVWVEPLTLAPQDLPVQFRNARLRLAKLRAYPQSQNVGDGDSIVVDLNLAAPPGISDMGMKLHETLRFSSTGVRHLPAGAN